MYIVTPQQRTVAVRARFLTPVSHHDPSVQDSSNVNLFLRRKQVIERTLAAPDPDAANRLARLLPVPAMHRDLFATLSAPDFLAVALLREFISAYGTADGLGLFSGPERYRRLEERARQQAIRNTSIFGWWGGLASDMQVGVPLRGDGEVQSALIAMPPALAQLVLAALSTNSVSALMLARLWAESGKAGDDSVVLNLPDVVYSESSRVVAEVPAISANSARHQMVREPGAWHLLNALSLAFEDLPDPVAALLYNGGDLNSSAPHDAFKLAREIRAAYPLLGLVGGTTSGFVLGDSNLKMSAWLICQENADALARYGIEPELSAFDLLDRHDMTRHTAKRVEGSPMPFGFEGLAAGVEALIEFRLAPYATPLEAGALVAALDTYAGGSSIFGGQAARGFGLAALDYVQVLALDDPDLLREQYEVYLTSNADTLRQGLLDGTLATDKLVMA